MTAMELAKPGSYGVPPNDFRMPDDVRLGPVRLQIADLDHSIEYYREVIGLRLFERTAHRATLGAPPDAPLVELNELKGAHRAPDRGRTGLFHFALLLPDRSSLGRFARHLVDRGERVGSADHHVSEAFYLQDPDNLGIEVYADRPRSAWRRVGRELVMGTEALDINGLLRVAGDEPWAGFPPDSTMGHMHLHVADLDHAVNFYSEALGFDRMVTGYPGALFLGAGGYHHHLGTNTWAGQGAKPPAADDAQLLEWTLELPDDRALSATIESLSRHDIRFEQHKDADRKANVLVRDPWGTALRLMAP